MFKLAYRLRVKYLDSLWKYYILKGDKKKADKTYGEIMKMCCLYLENFVTPIKREERS